MVRTLRAFVEARRIELGLNQTQLAAKAGVPRTTVNRVEKGTTQFPNADVRRKLAHALGVSHVDLLIAAGELEPEEVESAGVQGVVPENPNVATVVDALQAMPDFDADDATQMTNHLAYIQRIKGQRRDQAGEGAD